MINGGIGERSLTFWGPSKEKKRLIILRDKHKAKGSFGSWMVDNDNIDIVDKGRRGDRWKRG